MPFFHATGFLPGQFLSGAWIVLEGTLDLAWLEEVLRALVNQHEILRTRLQHTSGLDVPVQVIASDMRPPIRIIRADVIAKGKLFEPQTYYRSKLSDPVQVGTPPFGIEIVQVEKECHHLFLEADPLCCDAASLIFLAQALAASMSSPVPVPGDVLQYADFAESCEMLKQETAVRQAAQFCDQYSQDVGDRGDERP